MRSTSVSPSPADIQDSITVNNIYKCVGTLSIECGIKYVCAKLKVLRCFSLRINWGGKHYMTVLLSAQLPAHWRNIHAPARWLWSADRSGRTATQNEELPNPKFRRFQLLNQTIRAETLTFLISSKTISNDFLSMFVDQSNVRLFVNSYYTAGKYTYYNTTYNFIR